MLPSLFPRWLSAARNWASAGLQGRLAFPSAVCRLFMPRGPCRSWCLDWSCTAAPLRRGRIRTADWNHCSARWRSLRPYRASPGRWWQVWSDPMPGYAGWSAHYPRRRWRTGGIPGPWRTGPGTGLVPDDALRKRVRQRSAAGPPRSCFIPPTGPNTNRLSDAGDRVTPRRRCRLRPRRGLRGHHPRGHARRTVSAQPPVLARTGTRRSPSSRH